MKTPEEGQRLHERLNDLRRQELHSEPYHADWPERALAALVQAEREEEREQRDDLELMLRLAVQTPLRDRPAIHFAEQHEVGWKVTVWGPMDQYETERGYGEEFILKDTGAGLPLLDDAARASMRKALDG